MSLVFRSFTLICLVWISLTLFCLVFKLLNQSSSISRLMSFAKFEILPSFPELLFHPAFFSFFWDSDDLNARSFDLLV